MLLGDDCPDDEAFGDPSADLMLEAYVSNCVIGVESIFLQV